MVEELAQMVHVDASVISAMVIAALLIAALVVGFVLNRILHHWTKKLKHTWGEFFFALLEGLPLPLLILAALYVGLEMLALPRRYERLGSRLIFALLILILFYFPAKIMVLFLRRMGQREPHLEQVAQPATFLIRILFAVLAVIILLENLGISLTAVWTTLGIGSVAVALALQDTLGNFFAGLSLLMDRPIRPGDYIQLDAGQEGFVVRVGARSTTLRTVANNIVVVPNSTLSKSVITNLALPDPRVAAPVAVSVAYGTDPVAVERVLLEVAHEATQEGLEGLAADPPPVVRFHPGFGPSTLDFTLLVHVTPYTNLVAVQSDLRKRILQRFREEGIEIPFPTQTIRVESELPPSPSPPSRP